MIESELGGRVKVPEGEWWWNMEGLRFTRGGWDIVALSRWSMYEL